MQLHHVVERLGASVWDGVFLASGVALMGGGIALIRGALRGSPLPREVTAH